MPRFIDLSVFRQLGHYHLYSNSLFWPRFFRHFLSDFRFYWSHRIIFHTWEYQTFFSICAQNISFVNMILYFTDIKITSSSVTIVNIIITIEAQKRMYDGTDMWQLLLVENLFLACNLSNTANILFCHQIIITGNILIATNFAFINIITSTSRGHTFSVFRYF